MTAAAEGLRCYLVRHGTAAAGPDDRLRPLTPAGRSEVAAVARALRARDVAVTEIRHSGLARARETAEILAATLTPPGGVQATTGLAPEDDPEIARAELLLARAPLMLVGHLPHLGRLAAGLLGPGRGDGPSFAPATALGLRRAPDGWQVEVVLRPPPAGAR